MREHLSGLPEYLYRVAHKLDLYVGIAAGVVFLAFAYVASVGQHTTATATVSIVAISLVLSGYSVYREERQMREEREARVRVTATIGSWSMNHPDPGPDKASLSLHIFWEVWTEQDVSTESLGLNVIYQYDKKRWQLWKRTRFPQLGLPPKGKDTTSYRKRIYAGEFQPFRDDAVFEYVGDRNLPGDPHWLVELVLKTGIPHATYRVPVSFAQLMDELNSRGTNPPL